MSLIKKLCPAELAIALPLNLAERLIDLTDKERKLKTLVDEAYNIMWLRFDASEVDWDRYNEIRTEIQNLLPTYSGRFENYFLYNFFSAEETAKRFWQYR